MIYLSIFLMQFISLVKGKARGICIFAVGLYIALVAGFRSINIGIDTRSYFNVFMDAAPLSLYAIFDKASMEPGYCLFNYFICNLFGNFQVLLILISLFFVLTVSFLIYRYSRIPWMSFFLFVTFGFLTFSMSGLRQTIAIGLCVLCFLFMKNRKFIISVICLVSAVFFHYSAIFFVPVYFIDRLKWTKRNVAISIFIGAVVFIFSSLIFSFINNYARMSYESMDTGGNLMLLFNLFIVFIGLVYKDKIIAKDAVNSFFFYSMVFTVILFPLCKFHPAMFRTTFYYYIFMIIYIPNVIVSINDSTTRLLLTMLIISVAVYFFLYKVMIDINQFYPYQFFWEVN